MARSRIDTSLERTVVEGFAFPLGVYPAEELKPSQGFSSRFEPADGDDEGGEWEEWPDRYAYEIAITAERLEPLCRTLFSMLPGRVYPILDALGVDAYREVDPYIAYDLVGFDRFVDALRRHKGWFYEDGMVGFGAMALEPFVYVFVDEHKVVTVRVQTDLRERVEKVLQAFDLSATEELKCVDSVAHEHRSVLVAPPDRPDLLTAEEIVEELMDEWRLRLNVDRHRNTDEDGVELGVTGWRCLVRAFPEQEDAPPEYAELLLSAASLDEAERLSLAETAASLERGDARVPEPAPDQPPPPQEEGAGWRPGVMTPTSRLVREAGEDRWPDLTLVSADRVTPEELDRLLEEAKIAPPQRGLSTDAAERRVHAIRWLLA